LKSLSASKIKTKIKQERKAKDTVDVAAAITKYLDEKAYHYHNEAGKDMVEVHADWLYSYEEVKKLPNGIPPLRSMEAILASANLRMSSHEFLLVRTKLSLGRVS
jgi:hypothetical protein